jgi:hypothetical protein
MNITQGFEFDSSYKDGQTSVVYFVRSSRPLSDPTDDKVKEMVNAIDKCRRRTITDIHSIVGYHAVYATYFTGTSVQEAAAETFVQHTLKVDQLSLWKNM